MRLLIDFSHPRGQVMRVWLDNGEEWELQGTCKMCGGCCVAPVCNITSLLDEKGICKYLKQETVDGITKMVCQRVWDRPIGCLFYPIDPYDKLPDGCGFSWVKVKEGSIIPTTVEKIVVDADEIARNIEIIYKGI